MTTEPGTEEPMATEERMFTQHQVNAIVEKRVAGMTSRRELAMAREETALWRDRAQRNLGRIEELERRLEESREAHE